MLLSNRVMIQNGCDEKIGLYLDPRLLLILLLFCEKNIVRYAVHIISMLPIIGFMSDALIPTTYILLFLSYIYKYRVYVFFEAMCVLMFVFFAILLSSAIYPESSVFIFNPNVFWNIIFPSFKYFLISLIFIPEKKTMDILGAASCIAIIIESLFVIVYMIPRGLVQLDEMSRSYQILPNVLLAINYAFTCKKLIPWICSIAGLLYCLSMGTRGPLVIALVYIFFRFLRFIPIELWKKNIIAIFGICLFVLFFKTDLYITILHFLGNVFSQLGLSTRVIDLAISGEVVSHYSGRDSVFEYAIQKIIENPIWGYGVMGEWQWFGWNVHNIFLELLIHYGVILGSLILLWIIIISAKSYIKTNNQIARDVVLIWVCFVFVRGVFGGSYLSFGMFFLIGFCLSELRRIKLRVN